MSKPYQDTIDKAIAAPARPFINSRETLLVIDVHNGRQYASETKLFGDEMAKPSDAYQGVDAIRFIRFDLEELTGEDVTEDVANAWIQERSPDLDDPTDKVPDFVRFSEAWASYKADWHAERGNRSCPYSTLNMAQLGLSSPVAVVR